MNIRPGSLALASLALAVSACATIRDATPSVPVTIVSGGHVRVWSAYLREGEDAAVVRGMVAPERLWRGPISGHLHVAAFDAKGELIARTAARWSGTLSGRHRHSAPFIARLGFPRSQVARLTVSYERGAHNASEGFQ